MGKTRITKRNCSELRQIRCYIARDMESRVQYMYKEKPEYRQGIFVPDVATGAQYLDERSANMIGGMISIDQGQYAEVDIQVRITKYNANGRPAL